GQVLCYNHKLTNNLAVKKSVKKIKKIVFDHYGNQCECCKENNPAFLTIDHIEQDGARHRTPSGRRIGGEKLYSWLVKNNFPEGFRLLCYNCNCARSKPEFGGICPHKLQTGDDNVQ